MTSLPALLRQIRNRMPAVLFRLSATAFVVSTALFAFSIFNVRSLYLGWLATRGELTGMAGFVVELGNGGVSLAATDLGRRLNDGASDNPLPRASLRNRIIVALPQRWGLPMHRYDPIQPRSCAS